MNIIRSSEFLRESYRFFSRNGQKWKNVDFCLKYLIFLTWGLAFASPTPGPDSALYAPVYCLQSCHLFKQSTFTPPGVDRAKENGSRTYLELSNTLLQTTDQSSSPTSVFHFLSIVGLRAFESCFCFPQH